MYSTCLGAEFFYIVTVDVLASFPGPTQLSVTISTASNGKLGGAWERGIEMKVHQPCIANN